MKFPSFVRLPRNTRFTIEPRYYDPVKEEIEERTARIKKEMEGGEIGYDSSRISFKRKSIAAPGTSFLQLLIAAGLGTTLIGWLIYGNQVFYLLWLVVPIYLYFRIRRRTRK